MIMWKLEKYTSQYDRAFKNIFYGLIPLSIVFLLALIFIANDPIFLIIALTYFVIVIMLLLWIVYTKYKLDQFFKKNIGNRYEKERDDILGF